MDSSAIKVVAAVRTQKRAGMLVAAAMWLWGVRKREKMCEVLLNFKNRQ